MRSKVIQFQPNVIKKAIKTLTICALHKSMTKGCIPLHAEASRPCKPSVTDRNYCEIVAFLCLGAFHSSRPLSGDQNGGKSQAGGVSGVDIIVLTL